MGLSEQSDLFADESAPLRLPDGVTYRPALISAQEETTIAAAIAALELKPFAFHGFFGNRRTASFGWRYDFNGGGLQQAGEMPAFLEPLRAKAAAFANVAPDAFQHVLVTEYAAGAGIGWHKDRPQFGKVVGVSLRNACRFRFRRRQRESWERLTLNAAPRSAYLLDGEGRWEWEHSIPSVDALRYSVTFRTMRT
jgi:alkylated DNA repair dioxygenase AlkB